MILTKIFDVIMDMKGDFVVTEFRMRKRKSEVSYAHLIAECSSEDHLGLMMMELRRLGAVPTRMVQARTEAAPRDMILPDAFYSTANHPTSILVDGRWIAVEEQMMDKQIVYDSASARAYCKAIRDVKQGDLVVTGEEGIRTRPPERPRRGSEWFDKR